MFFASLDRCGYRALVLGASTFVLTFTIAKTLLVTFIAENYHNSKSPKTSHVLLTRSIHSSIYNQYIAYYYFGRACIHVSGQLLLSTYIT